MIWITKEEIIKIHSNIIEIIVGLDSIRNLDGLDAALSAPR